MFSAWPGKAFHKRVARSERVRVSSLKAIVEAVPFSRRMHAGHQGAEAQ